MVGFFVCSNPLNLIEFYIEHAVINKQNLLWMILHDHLFLQRQI